MDEADRMRIVLKKAEISVLGKRKQEKSRDSQENRRERKID